MSRLPNHTDRETTPPELHAAFDRVAELRNGAVSGPYGVLLHSPELAVRGAQLSNYVRWQSDLTPAQREIAILTTARAFDAAVMWAGHVRLGREAGVREEVIETIAERGDASALETEEAEIILFVRELFADNRISEAAFRGAARTARRARDRRPRWARGLLWVRRHGAQQLRDRAAARCPAPALRARESRRRGGTESPPKRQRCCRRLLSASSAAAV